MAEMFNSVSSETGYSVLEIHSRKAQNARERASEQFRKSGSAVLFSSDVSARGMDYPDVTFVLQVGLTDRSQYIHRLGRTARAGKDGKGGLLLADYEEQHMRRSEVKDMPLELIAPLTTRVADRVAVDADTAICPATGATLRFMILDKAVVLWQYLKTNYILQVFFSDQLEFPLGFHSNLKFMDFIVHCPS